ncbi:MAG: hypothetical protein JST16_11480 [Bdellovibrionales bacterium]|nr:hypothetical protein [Bdellovibrionales bacterium]
MLKVLSSAACALVFWGYLSKQNRRLHTRIMLSAFAVDMSLLLYVELTRKAIKTGLSVPHPFVSFHIGISVVVVAIYFWQMYSGIRAMRNNSRPLRHRAPGRAFLWLRTANLVTSFFVGNFVDHSVVAPPLGLRSAPFADEIH